MSEQSVSGTAIASNPLLESYKTPYQTIPFNSIKIEHYFPAFEEAMKVNRAEIDAIVNNVDIDSLNLIDSKISELNGFIRNNTGKEQTEDIKDSLYGK
jgi:peptidyl-dipeptidase Dcp